MPRAYASGRPFRHRRRARRDDCQPRGRSQPRCDQRLNGDQQVETAVPLRRQRVCRGCFSGSPQVQNMKGVDAVCCEDAEEPAIGGGISAWNIEPVEAETVERMTGLCDHDALAQLIERADHRGRGIDGNVIGQYQPGRRIDLATHRQARRRRRLASDQHSPGGDRVVIAERNHLLKPGVENSPLPIALA